MKIRTLTLFLASAVSFSVFAQKKELNSITEKELRAHLEFIAGDMMQGRDFGTPIPGLEITAGYLQSQCLGMGLKPENRNFSQAVEMTSVKPDLEKSVLRLKNGQGEVVFTGKNVVSFASIAKNDTINTDLVFAGYGYLNKPGDNDSDSLSLKNKAVLLMTGSPEIPPDSVMEMENINRLEMDKISPLMMAGVKTIIFTPDPSDTNNQWFGLIKEYAAGGVYKLEGDSSVYLPFEILFIDTETADAILRETGKTLLQLREEINKTQKPVGLEIKEVSAEITIVRNVKSVTEQNIIGVIEGSDPKLKNEYVILTAHYDHVGITIDGQINNGADDNGSGTVALLEVAEAFTKMKKKPRRSIIFAWVTAEEKGLFGSRYYTEHPVFPLSQTVANINLDMVGRSAPVEHGLITDVEKSLAGPNGVYFITGNKDGDIRKIGGKISKELNLVPNDELSEDFLNGSDYYHFHRKGIPVLGISTGLHEDYHKPSDDMEKIDYRKMKRIADLTFLIALEIANRKEKISQ